SCALQLCNRLRMLDRNSARTYYSYSSCIHLFTISVHLLIFPKFSQLPARHFRDSSFESSRSADRDKKPISPKRLLHPGSRQGWIPPSLQTNLLDQAPWDRGR